MRALGVNLVASQEITFVDLLLLLTEALPGDRRGDQGAPEGLLCIWFSLEAEVFIIT